MTRMMAVMVLAAAIATPAGAATASTEELFQQFGLFGTWATICQQAASPANPLVSITTPSAGLVSEKHDLGPDSYVNHYSMLSATRISGTRLSVEVIFRRGKEPEERQTLEFLVQNATRRTMFNQPAGAPVRVKNGIVLGYGSKTPVLRKCE